MKKFINHQHAVSCQSSASPNMLFRLLIPQAQLLTWNLPQPAHRNMLFQAQSKPPLLKHPTIIISPKYMCQILKMCPTSRSSFVKVDQMPGSAGSGSAAMHVSDFCF
ncbi:hypothetical protein XENORESO_014086 [Xenotaenia resolanae]|uniref:Uncharacterized protein n=1 Tax=Xenotaenia resolanae TaxID=208358 RepID=A0ABV0VWP3_9TELE